MDVDDGGRWNIVDKTTEKLRYFSLNKQLENL